MRWPCDRRLARCVGRVRARRAAVREFQLRAKIELLTFRYVKELKAKQAELDKAILDKTK